MKICLLGSNQHSEETVQSWTIVQSFTIYWKIVLTTQRLSFCSFRGFQFSILFDLKWTSVCIHFCRVLLLLLLLVNFFPVNLASLVLRDFFRSIQVKIANSKVHLLGLSLEAFYQLGSEKTRSHPKQYVWDIDFQTNLSPCRRVSGLLKKKLAFFSILVLNFGAPSTYPLDTVSFSVLWGYIIKTFWKQSEKHRLLSVQEIPDGIHLCHSGKISW